MERKGTDGCLRDWEHGGEVDDEVVLEVADGDLIGVPDELAAAEDAGAGGDERGAELEDHVREVEEVGEGAHDGDGDADAHVHRDAGVGAGEEEVEVHGVDEEADHAGDEEEAVPAEDDLVPRVEDAARRPWPAALGLGGGGGGRAGAGVEEGERRAAEGREDVAVEEAGHGAVGVRASSSCMACAGEGLRGTRAGAAAARFGCSALARPWERQIGIGGAWVCVFAPSNFSCSQHKHMLSVTRLYRSLPCFPQKKINITIHC